MIVELGHYALVLAVVTAFAQCAFPLWGAVVRDPALQSMARPSAFVTFILVVLSYGALTYAYVSSDFSVANVVMNSHSTKPLIYKISGVWSNHEGSMMLWVLILVFFAALVALRGGGMPERLLASVLSIQGAIALAFLIFIVLTSNPFLRLGDPPPDGQGLNPILADPGLAIHPPLLPRLCWLFRSVCICHWRADPWAYRCGMGAICSAMDLVGVDLSYTRHRDGFLLGLLRIRLGRMVVLGPG